MRHETKRQRDEREREPDPPGSQPEMVIDDRRRRADDEADAEPGRLAFHEKIHVAMAVLRERACAEKHDNPDDEHPQDSEEQEVSTLAMHSGFTSKSLSSRAKSRDPARTSLDAPRGPSTSLGMTAFYHSDFFDFFFSFGAIFSFGAGITSFWPIFNL